MTRLQKRAVTRWRRRPTAVPIGTYHEGRPIIRNSPDNKRVVVLCPYGHYHTSMLMKDWAGSWLEAKASDTNWTVRCDGALPVKGAVKP